MQKRIILYPEFESTPRYRQLYILDTNSVIARNSLICKATQANKTKKTQEKATKTLGKQHPAYSTRSQQDLVTIQRRQATYIAQSIRRKRFVFKYRISLFYLTIYCAYESQKLHIN